MKSKFFVRMNLVGTVISFLGFVMILLLINPFQASRFLIIVFYFTLFALIFGILNLLEKTINMPVWCRLLVAITIVLILVLRKNF